MRLRATSIAVVCLCFGLAALGQAVIPASPAPPDSTTTTTTDNCCNCSDPPGGRHCCANADDIIGCIVKDNHCNCTCFPAVAITPDKPDALATQSDAALRALLGSVPSNTSATQRVELFKKIVLSTESGNGYSTFLNDSAVRITLQPPKNWPGNAEVHQKAPLYRRLFQPSKVNPPPMLAIETSGKSVG